MRGIRVLGNKISFAYIQAVLTTICSNSGEVLQKTDKGTKSQNGNEGRSRGRREGERRKGKGREGERERGGELELSDGTQKEYYIIVWD